MAALRSRSRSVRRHGGDHLAAAADAALAAAPRRAALPADPLPPSEQGAPCGGRPGERAQAPVAERGRCDEPAGARRASQAKDRLKQLAQESFDHGQFSNPEANTCWVSCLFQALWHSVVFHAAFESFLAQQPTFHLGDILEAVRATWRDYKNMAVPFRQAAEADTKKVSAKKLAKALAEKMPGCCDQEGYGDMADALGAIQQELSMSSDKAAQAIGNLLVVVPVVQTCGDDDLPSPGRASRMLREFQLASPPPLVAVDLTYPETGSATETGSLTEEDYEQRALAWLPDSQSRHEGCADLADNYRLIALVCFMPVDRHYVAFCSCRKSREECMFFNDLPALTQDAPRTLRWEAAPALCAQFRFYPRLALYESQQAAEKAFDGQEHSSNAEQPVCDGLGAQRAEQATLRDPGAARPGRSETADRQTGAETRHAEALDRQRLRGLGQQAAELLRGDLEELGRLHSVRARLEEGSGVVELAGRCERSVRGAAALLREVLQFYGIHLANT